MSPAPTHAGCVVYRMSEGKALYLVVQSSDDSCWVLPKGHIEPNETVEAAALRELVEEAGIRGEIEHALSVQRFDRPDETVVIQYFLVRLTGTAEAAEERDLRWEPEEAAAALLTFQDTRELLLEGVAFMQGEERNENG